MKATGIVRRIDDLGRVVIPKEIRRTLRLREGTPLEIFTDREGEIILKKYSPMVELTAFASQYAEAMAQSTGLMVCITDRDQVIAVAGGPKKELLQKKFRKLGFTALNFTDSRSSFQFYSLGRLWEDIQIALNEGITLLNVATEPVTAAELYKALTGDVFKNELKGTPAKYDFRTTYASKFGGKDGYICSKEEVLADIRLFVKHMITEGVRG